MLKDPNLVQTAPIFMGDYVHMTLIDNVDPVKLLIILIFECVLQEIQIMWIIFVLINFENR
jgi:hypothetical protein